ncbi:uncharacterized protein B0T15DRAFT_404370 [Chaetomium strumarium]|uniref:Serine-rich protein n=1 Tax=Chaetomium strumarium TaxID=1170767 RepID=A0AAJ0GLJ7_9PEZI|nr:hypothetical protein B0T15DRAFT_404370 [Chaetomium strumarium]
MSSPPTRHGPTTPPKERSKSQNSKAGIRLVPYSPPRLDPEERAPSQTSSRENAGSRSSGIYDDQANSGTDRTRRSSWKDEVTEGHGASQGPALSSPSGSGASLAKFRDERVSGVKPLASPSGVGHAYPTARHLRSVSEVSLSTITGTGPDVSESRRSRASSSASSTHGRPRSLSRRLRLAVHPNGTFSLVPEEPLPEASPSLTSPHPSYASRTPSAQDRPSIDTWSDRRASTPLTGASTVILDQSFSEEPHSTSSSRASSSTQLAEDSTATTSSPWNYRLIGGVRKVPSTPEKKGKQPVYNTSTSTPETQLAPLPEAATTPGDDETPTRTVVPKTSSSSVASNQTIETVSEATNYKVYGPGSSAQDSNDSLDLNPASASNWEVLGQSSPAYASSPPATSHGGNENYVLHGAASESPSSSLATVVRKPRPEYSQESLVVPPLRPIKKRSHERFGYYKQRSRETLRSRTGSVQSLKSLSSIVTSQDPSLAFAAAPAVLNLAQSSSQRFPWAPPQTPGSGSSSPQGALIQRPSAPVMSHSHPHQWSSQLSTVMSESEGGSDPARSVSPLSSEGAGHHRRRSSTGWVSSMHSRQMPSISSSIALQLDEAAAASGSDPLDRPRPSHSRGGLPGIRLVRDQDEHGDGLADLEHRPSQTGLSTLFLHSGASSRANSFTSTVPAWARVYYGSGERRFLGRRPSFLTVSESSDSRPPSSGFLGSESPNSDNFNFPQAIFSPRRRAREVQPAADQRPAPDHASMEISPAPSPAQPPQDHRVFRSLREKTSSIWSPHLQPDRRASRYSVWDPPSVNWSADSGILGKRNIQVILFILGFVLPLAWMVAAVLPLPPNPKLRMLDVENSQGRFGSPHPAFRYQQQLLDELRYESARWWRNLNRGMSVVGLLIIGAIIALAVVGVRQGWGHR